MGVVFRRSTYVGPLFCRHVDITLGAVKWCSTTKGVYVEECCLYSRRRVVIRHLAGGNEQWCTGATVTRRPAHCGVVVAA